MEPELRERLGRRVREVWVAWAIKQSNVKASWILPWDQLDEAGKEVDRCIGESLFMEGVRLAIDVCETRADGERVYSPGPVGEGGAAPYERAIEDIRQCALDGMMRPLGGAYAGLTAKK